VGKRPVYDTYQRGRYKGYKKKEIAAWNKVVSRIPEFSCIPGCHRCCKVIHREGLVLTYDGSSVTDVEMKKYRMKGPCQRFVEGIGCTVYDKGRPFLCLLYGVSEIYPCRRGIKPKKMLTKQETVEMFNELIKTVPREWLGSCP